MKLLSSTFNNPQTTQLCYRINYFNRQWKKNPLNFYEIPRETKSLTPDPLTMEFWQLRKVFWGDIISYVLRIFLVQIVCVRVVISYQLFRSIYKVRDVTPEWMCILTLGIYTKIITQMSNLDSNFLMAKVKLEEIHH